MPTSRSRSPTKRQLSTPRVATHGLPFTDVKDVVFD